VSNSGSVTLPALPASPESRVASEAGAGPFIALVLAWSADQPERVGEVALLDPSAASEWILGRGHLDEEEATARVRWIRQRPGGTPMDGGPLAGAQLSRRQLRLFPAANAVRVENIGRVRVQIDGSPLPADGTSVLARPGAVIGIDGHSVFLVVRRPVVMRRAPGASAAATDDRGPFGHADADGIVGESPAAWALRAAIRSAVRTGGHVLVHGPSGSGKELVARAIHRLSRCNGRLVPFNAATLTSSLADSIFFGNPRNYPNPGVAERRGLVGEAHGGTLFLDEIGELPLDAQARLLRVLEGEYTPLGEAVPRRAELRLVGATNRELGAIRHDVLRRFSYLIETPPLEARIEDVPLLARAIVCGEAERNPDLAGRFVSESSAAAGREAMVSQGMAVAMLRMRYEGGVRDLRNFLVRGMNETEEGAIEVPEEHGMLWGQRLASEPPRDEQMGECVEEASSVDGETGDDSAVGIGLSGSDLYEAITRCGWNVSLCAEAMGVSRHRLQRMLRCRGIRRPR
jgi:two-component system response regulator HydG